MLISVIISLVNYNYSSNYNMHIPSYTKIYYSYIDHPLHTHYVDLILYILICEYCICSHERSGIEGKAHPLPYIVVKHYLHESEGGKLQCVLFYSFQHVLAFSVFP